MKNRKNTDDNLEIICVLKKTGKNIDVALEDYL